VPGNVFSGTLTKLHVQTNFLDGSVPPVMAGSPLNSLDLGNNRYVCFTARLMNWWMFFMLFFV